VKTIRVISFSNDLVIFDKVDDLPNYRSHDEVISCLTSATVGGVMTAHYYMVLRRFGYHPAIIKGCLDRRVSE
jgi:hypothetical protein